MAIQNKTFYVGDVEYSVTSFTASKGLQYVKQLSKIIAPSMAALAGNNTELPNLAEMTVADATLEDGFLKAATLLVENMDKEDVVQLIKNLVSSCRRDNKDINFDQDYSCNYGELVKVLIEVVKFNFSDVFPKGAFG